MKRKQHSRHIIVIALLLLQSMAYAELLMHTHGYIAFAPYVTGVPKEKDTYPGYRAEFLSSVDIFNFGRTTVYGMIGNTTLMNLGQVSGFKLNKIRYNLAASARYEFDNWLIKGSFYRGSIHKISQSETGTPIWWNSIQLGVGSKGAYYLYLPEEYRKVQNRFLNTLDAQINAGVFIKPRGNVYTGMNHHFKYEVFSLLRYHLGAYKKWAAFAGLSQNTWFLTDSGTEHKINLTLNLFRKGAVNFAGFFYTYTLYDNFYPDNDNHMGQLGARVIF